MLKLLPRYLLILLLLPLASCSQPEPQLFNYRFFTFGTDITVSIYGSDKKQADTGFANTKDLLQKLNKQLHPWTPGELHSFNIACSKSQQHTISALLKTMILEGQRFYSLSDGLFDPAVGSLVKLWKFDNAANIHTSIPQSFEIENIQNTRPSISQVQISDNTALCSNNLVRLDFGGFAKGYATEEAIKILLALGIDNAIINAGGDLTAIGSKGDNPWVIGIRNPFNAGAIASIQTYTKTNIFTSGNYERFFEKEGKVYHHIIDPQTGYPTTEIASVTVIHDNAMQADAAATAIMVSGIGRWKDISSKMGITKLMIVSSDKKILITPQMNALVTILDNNLTKVIEDTQ